MTKTMTVLTQDYDLNGIKVNPDALDKGIYIRRNAAGVTEKVFCGEKGFL